MAGFYGRLPSTTFGEKGDDGGDIGDIRLEKARFNMIEQQIRPWGRLLEPRQVLDLLTV